MKEYSIDFVKCGQCQSHFPKSWLKHPEKTGAVRLGVGAFCSSKCKEAFIAMMTATSVGNPTLHLKAKSMPSLKGQPIMNFL